MSLLTTVLFYRKRIAALFSAILAITFAYALLAPKKYQSHMKVLVKHERADSLVSPDSSNAVVRGEVSESDVNSEIELLTSSELLRHVVIRNGLDRFESGGPQAAGESVERAVRRLTKNLKITPVRKANIIQIAYTSESATQSAAVLSTLAELYLQDHLRIHRTAGTHEFFRSQAAEYSRQLDDAQGRLSEFRRSNNVVLLTEQKDLMLRRVMDTEQALNETVAALGEAAGRLTTLKRQLAALQPRVMTQSRVVPNQYSVERLHTMLADLHNRRTALLAKFRSDDRLVLDLSKQMEDTSAALAQARELTSVEQTTDVNPLRQSLEAQLAQAEISSAGLESRRKSLTELLTSWRTRLARLDTVTPDHDGLIREIKQIEENVLLYSRKQEEARIADSLDQQKFANVSIAEPPSKPYLPSQPNVALNLALGFLLACLVSGGTALALDMNRTTFDTDSELQDALNLPVLASVPMQGV